MIQKYLFMGMLLDDPCVIHKPKPYLGGWQQTLRLFPENIPLQIGNYRTYWWAHSLSLNLLIEFILKRKVSIMQAEPQEFIDVLHW